MPTIPCPNKIGCDSDYPVTNYSSEDADPRSFIGTSTGIPPTCCWTGPGGGGPRGGGPDRDDTGDGSGGTAQTGTGAGIPPLGSDYDNPIVTTFAESVVSQAEAWDDAGNDNVSATTVPSDTGEPGGGIVLNPSRLRPPVFGNDQQQWTQLCPDDTPFTFTVAANKYRAYSKAKANAEALSEARKQAQLNILCLSSINGNICVEQFFSQSIRVNTANFPVTFVITSGDIPDWMTAQVGDDTVQLSGTPEVGDIADTTFTLTAIDVIGFSISKEYTISVTSCECDITTLILDEFDQGQFYSFQLTSTAVEPAFWEIIAGELPTGLSLAAGGNIFGTPNLDNGNLDQTFTVKVTGDDGGTCSKTLTIEVMDYNDFPTDKHWRIDGYADGLFDSLCAPGVVSGFTWNGEWTGKLGDGWFKGTPSNDIFVMASTVPPSLPSTARAGRPYLLKGVAIGQGVEWWVWIPAYNGTAGVWTGKKAGSNAGAKLDSPAGVYTFEDTGAFTSMCTGAIPPTVTIEEF